MTVQNVALHRALAAPQAAGLDATHDPAGQPADVDALAHGPAHHMLADPPAGHLPHGGGEPEGDSLGTLYARLSGKLPLTYAGGGNPAMAAYSAAMASKLNTMIWFVQSNIINEDAPIVAMPMTGTSAS